MSAPAAASPRDDEALSDLENALTDIDGIAQVLLAIGAASAKGLGLNPVGACYLGGQLEEHRRQAHDAFCRLACYKKVDRPSSPQENESVG